ncbi:MAG TPA: YeeE/YedE family protein [Reyranella sp.]|nr:YeeE/YedE family protein [Reyranella sp.]
MGLDTPATVALAAFAIGIAFGALARWSGFCLRGAVEDVLTRDNAPRARGFLLAMVVALIAVQALVLTGRLDISKAVVMPTSLFWGGALLGGLLFGVGMVLTGGCGTRMLVLAAGGNLRSAVVFFVFGFVAYATIRGILAPARAAFMDMASVKLAHQALPLIVGPVVLVLALAFILWRRVELRHLLGGALIGLLVPLGYWVTGVLGNDDFDQTTVESINVTRGGGDALVYLLTWTGSKINFGIAFVAGILVGALAVALLRRDFKLEGFERPADMLRYAAGAALMGVGGVLALGCTVGNGLTGIASLAPTSFIALPAMVLAAAAAMKWRWRTKA